MPTSIGGFVKWAVGSIVVSAIGIAVLSRTPLWSKINKGA